MSAGEIGSRLCYTLFAPLLLCLAACGEEAVDLERPAVAVLPCDDLSPDSTDAYLAAGLHDEILLKLANISGLISISRSAVEYFRDNPVPLAEMAARLGVGFVGECSVRKEPEGEEIRLTFQLLEPSGAQVWAENYDAVLTAGSLLEMESDIAQRVASAVGATVTPEERARVQEKPTEDAQAYELYLRAWRYMMRGPAQASYRSAAQLLQQATELDPDFAEAHAYLAYTHLHLFWFFGGDPEQLQMGRESLQRADSLKPDAPEVHRVKGALHVVDGDLDRALEEYDLALETRIEAPTLALKSAVLGWQERYEEQLRLGREAARLDPLSFPFAYNTGNALTHLRRFAEAEKEYERARSLGPDQPVVYAALAQLHVAWHGNTERARSVLQAANEAGVHGPLDTTWVWLEMLDRNYDAVLERLSPPSPGPALPSDLKHRILAKAYAGQGQENRALAHYDSARLVLEEKVRQRPHDAWLSSDLGIVLAGLGRKEEAIREGKRALELVPNSRQYHLRSLAKIYAMVGEPEAAIDRIQEVLSMPAYLTVPYLKLDPDWDPLRDHPRFQALVEG